MMTTFEQRTRRRFLQTTVAGTALAALPTAGIQAANAPMRSGRPYMKLALAGYSFNRFMARRGTPAQIAAAKMTLEKFIDFCAEQDLDGTELTGYYFPKEVTNDYLMSIKARCFHAGLDISGTAIGNDFCLVAGPKRDAQIADCKLWIDYAAAIGAPVIRIFAGKVPKGDSEDASIDRCVAGINECLQYAAEKGVCLALENHGGITATPAQMMEIIERVDDSPWFGVNFDGGNFRTDDPYRDLAVIAPYAINAQVKVAVGPKGNQQPADLARVVQILKDAGYRGYLVLEYEEKQDPWTHIPDYLKQLRDLIS